MFFYLAMISICRTSQLAFWTNITVDILCNFHATPVWFSFNRFLKDVFPIYIRPHHYNCYTDELFCQFHEFFTWLAQTREYLNFSFSIFALFCGADLYVLCVDYNFLFIRDVISIRVFIFILQSCIFSNCYT